MGLAHPVSRQQCKILNAKENISGKNGSPVPDRNAGIALAHAPNNRVGKGGNAKYHVRGLPD